MTKWEYFIGSTWWGEKERTEDATGFSGRITYEHRWQTGGDVHPYAQGLAELGADGWELVTITTRKVSLQTKYDTMGGEYMTFDDAR